MTHADWAKKTKVFLIDLTCIIFLILTVIALIWEHLRHLFK